MNTETYKPQVAREQLSDLNETLEKEKVELAQAVEKYARDHVRIVHNKLQAGEPVHENDLAFIPKVKLWVLMPKEWREEYKSVEEMEKSDEYSELLEAKRRNISIQQWLDLLHVADAAKKSKEWIDKTFTFPGAGKIETVGDLFFGSKLTSLPDGLSVGRDLYLKGCTGLTKLPENLSIGGRYLTLSGCTGLTKLPERLKIRAHLYLTGCTGLTELPGELMALGDLWLSANLNEQVKKDAERLKKEGKIGGEIIYK